jgi:hypothetical protein
MAQQALNTTAMSAASANLRTQDKFLSLTAWGVAIGIFASVGWMAIEPLDPVGAVSLVTSGNAVLMMIEVLALSAIVSGVATALIGRKLPDAGVFAAALGLAAANLRGDTTTYLLLTVTGSDAAARDALAGKLAFEGLAWFAAVVVAAVASGWVTRWVIGSDQSAGDVGLEETALSEVTSRLPVWDDSERPTGYGHWLDGLKVTVVSLVAAIVLFRLLATGSPWRSVQHGQSYFALAVAFYVGGLIAQRLWRMRSALWVCLGPPLLCLLGYLFCAISSSPKGPYGTVASVPPSVFFRALPIEYICVGTAAAVMSFWSARRHWLLHAEPARTRQGR